MSLSEVHQVTGAILYLVAFYYGSRWGYRRVMKWQDPDYDVPFETRYADRDHVAEAELLGDEIEQLQVQDDIDRHNR